MSTRAVAMIGPVSRRRSRPRAVLLVLLLSGGGLQTVAIRSQPAVPVIDVVVLDKSGHPVTDLTAKDFRVAIDGRPRAVVSARYVYRGPDAAAQAMLAADRTGQSTLLERSRTVLLAVDESSFPTEREKAARTAAVRILALLGPQDRAALVALPADSDRLAFSLEHRALQDAAVRLRGRAAVAGSDTGPRAVVMHPNVADREPESGYRRSRERSLGAVEELGADGSSTGDSLHPITSLLQLSRLLSTLGGEGGLKSVVYVASGSSSSGLYDPDAAGSVQSAVAALRQAAAASRTVIHVVLVAHSRDTRVSRPDLESVATETGGLVAWAREDGSGVERVGVALRGSYLLELAATENDKERAHSAEVRVISRRQGSKGTGRAVVELAAPTLWRARNDPFPRTLAPTGTLMSDKAVEVTLSRTCSKKEGKSAGPSAELRVPDLRPILARVRAYVAQYLTTFSNVVAGEDYVQVVKRQPDVDHFTGPSSLRRRLLSDLMLLRVEGPDVWIPHVASPAWCRGSPRPW